MISLPGNQLADPGAGELDPPHVGGELGELVLVRAIEVEEDAGSGEELAPHALVRTAPPQLRAYVVARVPGAGQQVGLVDDLHVVVDFPDA